jgi:hypothetical protein
MKKIQLKKSYYKQGTSVWLKVFGDFLNYVGAGASVSAIISNEQNYAILFIILGALGKAITNAFTEVEVTSDAQEG